MTRDECLRIVSDARARGERPDLRNANLRGVDLQDAVLCGANMARTDLTGADLRCADLREADLRGADLREADLSAAYLRDADLREAQLGYPGASAGPTISLEQLGESPTLLIEVLRRWVPGGLPGGLGAGLARLITQAEATELREHLHVALDEREQAGWPCADTSARHRDRTST